MTNTFEIQTGKKVNTIVDVLPQAMSGEPCLQITDYMLWALHRAYTNVGGMVAEAGGVRPVLADVPDLAGALADSIEGVATRLHVSLVADAEATELFIADARDDIENDSSTGDEERKGGFERVADTIVAPDSEGRNPVTATSAKELAGKLALRRPFFPRRGRRARGCAVCGSGSGAEVFSPGTVSSRGRTGCTCQAKSEGGQAASTQESPAPSAA